MPAHSMFHPEFSFLRLVRRAVMLCGIILPSLIHADEEKTIQIVHLTDVHMRPNFDAPQRLPLALRDIRTKNPALIINTGDTIDGSAGAPEKWNLWHAAVAAEIGKIPLYNLITLSPVGVVSVVYTRYPDPFIDKLPKNSGPAGR